MTREAVVAWAALATAIIGVGACDGELRLPAAAVDTAPDGSSPPDASAGEDSATGATARRCTRDSDCANALLHCDVPTGACFGCTSDAHCTGAKKRCDAALHRCVECGITADCGAGKTCEP